MTKNMEEGYHGSATSLKSSSGHLQERKEWKGSRGNKNQRKQQPNLFVTENLINNQSEKEMEIFIHVNLRIITQESSQKALRTVLVRQVGKLVCLWFGKGACAFKRTSQQMVAVNGFGAFVIIERARNWVHNIFSWKFQSIWGPALQVLPGHKVPHPDLHLELLSGCNVGQGIHPCRSRWWVTLLLFTEKYISLIFKPAQEICINYFHIQHWPLNLPYE